MMAHDGKSVDTWKQLVTKHLGRKMKGNTQRLMMDILAVDAGIKLAYLYDLGKPESVKLVNLLRELNVTGQISSHCSVLQIGLDCLVVNVESIKTMDVTEDGLTGQLINVSSYLGAPCLYEGREAKTQLIKVFQEIRNGLDGNAIGLHIKQEPECNVSSLFGLLLDYPVLYWFDTENESDGNCLSMESLTCVKLNVCYKSKQSQMSDNKGSDANKGRESMIDPTYSHCLYSFSYPTCLKASLIDRVDKWLHELNERIHSSMLFHVQEFSQEERTLDVVCL